MLQPPNPAQSQIAKAIAGTPATTPTRPPAALSLTRGVVSSTAVTVGGITSTTVQLGGSSTDVPADVVGGINITPGDVVEVLVAPPRVVILGTSAPTPTPPPPATGGYASLTGPGSTTTPGALTQKGGFSVDDTALGDGILLVEGSTGIFDGGIYIEERGDNGLYLSNKGIGPLSIYDYNTGSAGLGLTSNNSIGLDATSSSTGGITFIDHGSGGISISENGTGSLNINTSSLSSGINIGCSGTTGTLACQAPNVSILANPNTANVRGLAGTIIGSSAGGSTLGFYGITGVAQQAHCVTLADVITVLANLGLTA